MTTPPAVMLAVPVPAVIDHVPPAVPSTNEGVTDPAQTVAAPPVIAATVGNALKMALTGRIDKNACPVHHSDRGIQYCSKEYTDLAISNGLKLSMTQNGDPYENALAERMNRTLKEEFGLGMTLPNKKNSNTFNRRGNKFIQQSTASPGTKHENAKPNTQKNPGA